MDIQLDSNECMEKTLGMCGFDIGTICRYESVKKNLRD